MIVNVFVNVDVIVNVVVDVARERERQNVDEKYRRPSLGAHAQIVQAHGYENVHVERQRSRATSTFTITFTNTFTITSTTALTAGTQPSQGISPKTSELVAIHRGGRRCEPQAYLHIHRFLRCPCPRFSPAFSLMLGSGPGVFE